MGTTEKSSSIAWRPTGDAAPKQPEVRELRAHVFILLLGTWNVFGTGKRHCDRKFLSREIKADHKVLDQTKAFKPKHGWIRSHHYFDRRDIQCVADMGGMIPQRSRVSKGIVFLLFLMILGGPLATQAASTTRIRLSQSNVGLTATPLWVAASHRFFAKYALELEPVYVRNSTIQIMALTTGEVQLSHTGGAPTLNAAAQGHDLKIVATFGHGVYWDIVARPEIRTLEELRGKNLGVTNVGGTTWIGAILGLEHFNLTPDRDRIQLQGIGDQTVLLQALGSGRVDAVLVEPSFTRELKKRGFKVLAELSSANIPFASSGLVVPQTYLKKEPDVVENVLKALIEATAFLYKPANRRVVLEILTDRLKLSDTVSAKEALQDLDKLVAKRPYPDLDGLRNIQRVMKYNPSVARIKVDSVIDDRIYRKLEESQFLDRAYNY
jgi:NitT/TauT family transport system substrate-binding protein